VLLEGGYKADLQKGNPLGVLSAFARNLGLGDTGNPLTKDKLGEYEIMNRDSALQVAQTYCTARPPTDLDGKRTFVYISAEDVFRPFVPKRYIDTKREAEENLAQLCASEAYSMRSVFMRPALMYHPHLRPMTTPLAVLLDLSSRLHQNPPFNVRGALPSSILRSIAPGSLSSVGLQDNQNSSRVLPSSLDSFANLLEVPPIHVDQVAEAIVTVITNRPDVSGPVGVEAMRRIIGWRNDRGHAAVDETQAKTAL